MQKAKGAGTQAQPCTGHRDFPCKGSLFKGKCCLQDFLLMSCACRGMGQVGRDGENVLLRLSHTIFQVRQFWINRDDGCEIISLRTCPSI